MNDILNILKRLGPGRLSAMIGVTLVLLGFFAFVMMRMSQPTMSLLYSDLSPQDAAGITRDLEARGIKYETRGEGGTIFAPASEVGRLRMEFAGKGLPSGGGVGYEIFDKGDAFSATNFVQGINYMRAMEGELSRTIRSISKVQNARVHLAIPERRLFDRDREPPRASIVLKLAGDLDASQVRAIRHLVASAVEGMKPERVSIVDERGRLLADGSKEEGPGIFSNTDEKQAAFEQRLRGQVEDIVAGVVGPGRARVQVSSELDMNRVENHSETYDPESRVVRSTQTRTESQLTSPNQDTVSVGNELPAANQPQTPTSASKDTSNKNEEIVNYEISRTTRNEVLEGGRVKRLSVAVLVDGIYPQTAGGEATYQPRPQEELDRIAALVRSTVGYDKTRGDQIEVVNLRFAEAPLAAEPQPQSLMASLFSFTKDDMVRGFEVGVLGILAVIVLLTVVRPLVRTAIAPDAAELAQQQLAAPEAAAPAEATAQAELPGPQESQATRMLEIAKVNGQIQAQSIERVGAIVKNNPSETMTILRQWIHEGA